MSASSVANADVLEANRSISSSVCSQATFRTPKSSCFSRGFRIARRLTFLCDLLVSNPDGKEKRHRQRPSKACCPRQMAQAMRWERHLWQVDGKRGCNEEPSRRLTHDEQPQACHSLFSFDAADKQLKKTVRIRCQTHFCIRLQFDDAFDFVVIPMHDVVFV